jgi:hypothetical protein
MKRMACAYIPAVFGGLLLSLWSPALGTSLTLRGTDPTGVSGIELYSAGFQSGAEVKTVEVTLSERDLSLYTEAGGRDILSISGGGLLARPGEPAVPVKTLRLELPANAGVTGIEVTRPVFAEAEGRFRLAPAPEPMRLTGGRTHGGGGFREDIYGKDACYPGGAVSYVAGSSGRSTVVYLRFYPVQYNPVTGAVLIITEAAIEIHYEIEPARAPAPNSSVSDARNIILTTSSLLAPAESLLALHENLEGLASDVVTVEWIDSAYAEAEEPGQPGYANMSGSPVSGPYDYGLARKIVAFLRDASSHPDLESVTLFGDALEVPPSYYFYVPQYTEYNNWIPSDLFYASPDYDMALNYQVGRLPVSTVEEAEHMVEKYRAYKAGLDPDWFHNAALFGGATFNTVHLFGEIGILHAIESGHLKGHNIEKNFHSNFRETRDYLVPHFTDENTGIIFASGHGSGVSYIMTSTTMHCSEFAAMPPTSRYPLLFMVACLNGSYDAELVPNGYGKCYGERALASPAGPIAFWGSARTAFVGYEYCFGPNGTLAVAGSRYLSGIMINCLKAYSAGATSLGEIALGAFDEYMLVYEPENYVDRVTAYEYTFLGDPAFSVPPAPASAPYENVIMGAEPPPDEAGWGFDEAVYYSTVSFSPDIAICGETDSPGVTMRICKLEAGLPTVTQELALIDEILPFCCDFTPAGGGLFFAAFETDDWRETRLYFGVEPTDNIPPSEPELKAIVPAGVSYDVLWSPAFDREGGAVTYELKELASPSTWPDSCDSLGGWLSRGFAVSAGGLDGTACFWSGKGNNINNTITMPVALPVVAGDSLIFWKKYYIEDSWDFAYVEVSADGADFSVIDKYTGTSSAWTRSALDLGPYAGDSVFIRFRYTTDFVIAKDGLYIDNVSPAIRFENIATVEDITDTVYHFPGSPAGHYCYQVRALDEGGASSRWSDLMGILLADAGVPGGGTSDPADGPGGPADGPLPAIPALRANAPNPFRDHTSVTFGLPAPAPASIAVYGTTGRLVRQLAGGRREAGWHTISWDGLDSLGRPVAPGVYFIHMETSDFRSTLKTVRLR